jgi:hypothetical protein
VTTEEQQRLKLLERENREFRRANEILRRPRRILPRRSSTAAGRDGGVHRLPQCVFLPARQDIAGADPISPVPAPVKCHSRLKSIFRSEISLMHPLSPRPPRLRYLRVEPLVCALIIATFALAGSRLPGAAAATPSAFRHAVAALKHAALVAASATDTPSRGAHHERSAAHHARRMDGTLQARRSASTTMLLSQSLTNYGTERGAPIATSVNTAHCLDAGQFAAGNGLYLWDCNGQPQQSFSWSTEGMLRVSLYGTTLCLQDRAGAAANGDVVELAVCTGAWNQRWEPHDDGVSIRLAGTARCLDLAGANLVNGSIIQIWDCWGGTNQHWLANDPTCGFRSIPITRFARSRSLVSLEADHSFRSKLITHFARS